VAKTPDMTLFTRSRPRQIGSNRADGFGLDAVSDADLIEPPHSAPTVGDLETVVASPLLSPEVEVKPTGQREYGFRQPRMAEAVRLSTDPTYHQ
jgi:hypothetical protein